jgi:hypothetical protein
MATAREVAISRGPRGPWPDECKQDAFELLFDDGSPTHSPFGLSRSQSRAWPTKVVPPQVFTGLDLSTVRHPAPAFFKRDNVFYRV